MSYRQKMQWCLDGQKYVIQNNSNRSGPDEAPTWEVNMKVTLSSISKGPYFGSGTAGSIKAAKEIAASVIFQRMQEDNCTYLNKT